MGKYKMDLKKKNQGTVKRALGRNFREMLNNYHVILRNSGDARGYPYHVDRSQSLAFIEIVVVLVTFLLL